MMSPVRISGNGYGLRTIVWELGTRKKNKREGKKGKEINTGINNEIEKKRRKKGTKDIQ